MTTRNSPCSHFQKEQLVQDHPHFIWNMSRDMFHQKYTIFEQIGTKTLGDMSRDMYPLNLS